MSLCKTILKLTQQLTNLVQIVASMHANLFTHVASSSVKNFSKEMNKLRQDLKNALVQLERTNLMVTASQPPMSELFSSDTAEFYIFLILDCLKHEHFLLAAQYLKMAQASFAQQFNDLDNVLLWAFERLKLKHQSKIFFLKSNKFILTHLTCFNLFLKVAWH